MVFFQKTAAQKPDCLRATSLSGEVQTYVGSQYECASSGGKHINSGKTLCQ